MKSLNTWQFSFPKVNSRLNSDEKLSVAVRPLNQKAMQEFRSTPSNFKEDDYTDSKSYQQFETKSHSESAQNHSTSEAEYASNDYPLILKNKLTNNEIQFTEPFRAQTQHSSAYLYSKENQAAKKPKSKKNRRVVLILSKGRSTTAPLS